jgi:hypothetical protein
MMGFIGLFDTARDYILQYTAAHNSVHSYIFTPLLGYGLQPRTLSIL